ncbi:MAG TPA: DUF3592 domain-containing protein [Acidobacteriaceae bacterium]|jgi:hypothetical protein
MKKQGLWLKILKIGMWLFLANATIFSLLAAGFALNTTIFLARSIRAEGKVTALVHIEDGDEDTTYRPVFTFVTRDGVTQTVKSNAGSNPPEFELGEGVPVRYRAADPSAARIDTFWQIWAFPVGFTVFGCLAGLVGWFFRWRVHKRLNAAPKLRKIRSLDAI